MPNYSNGEYHLESCQLSPQRQAPASSLQVIGHPWSVPGWVHAGEGAIEIAHLAFLESL